MDISDCGVTNEEAEHIGEALKLNCPLRVLLCAGNWYRILSIRCCTVLYIYATNSSFSLTTTRCLQLNKGRNRNLTHLDLSHNSIGEDQLGYLSLSFPPFLPAARA